MEVSRLTFAEHSIGTAINDVAFQNEGNLKLSNGFAKIIGPHGGVSIAVNVNLFGSKIIISTFKRINGTKHKFNCELPKVFK